MEDVFYGLDIFCPLFLLVYCCAAVPIHNVLLFSAHRHTQSTIRKTVADGDGKLCEDKRSSGAVHNHD